jgi:hypothetical protein
LLAMDVNDNAGSQAPCSVLGFIASKLAPTGFVYAGLFDVDLGIVLPPKRADGVPLDILACQREGRRVGQG